MKLVFFDMDKTLLSKSSGNLLIRYLVRNRMVTLSELISMTRVTIDYSLNILDFPKAMARLSKSIRGGSAAHMKRVCDQWAVTDVFRYIAPKALSRLREHQARGDMVYLLSASTQFAVRPVADHIGVPYRCTELEIVDGIFTGAICDVDCFGEGKRVWGERLAAQHGVALAECTLYTDSYSDRPLLNVVGNPVPVNPDRSLRRYAAQRGWVTEYFY
jgi:HAD superfamily hydrolase (TIGR01490 family)